MFWEVCSYSENTEDTHNPNQGFERGAARSNGLHVYGVGHTRLEPVVEIQPTVGLFEGRRGRNRGTYSNQHQKSTEFVVFYNIWVFLEYCSSLVLESARVGGFGGKT